jgi:hypothetical protein
MNRPETLESWVSHIETGYEKEYGEKLYLTVSEMDRLPYEVFVKIGKAGQLMQSFCESQGRLMTLAFRAQTPVEKVVNQLVGINDGMPLATNHGLITSIPDGIGQALRRRYL